MEAIQNNQSPPSSYSQWHIIIQSVRTPLGFFALTALILNAILLILIPFVPVETKTALAYGCLFLLACDIGCVVIFSSKVLGQTKEYTRAPIQGTGTCPIEQGLSGRLLAEVQELYKKDSFVDTVRFGSRISRALWLSGRYHERIAIGQMIEDAASRSRRIDEQVQALIDDIGWTNFIVGNAERAEYNISHGVELALYNKLYYWAAKGERHLAGIADIHDHDMEKANEHLLKAKKYAEDIAPGEQRDETLGGLEFAFSEFALKKGDANEALQHCQSAKTIYDSTSRQRDRSVKIHSLLGRIYIALGKFDQARDAFRWGLECAKQLSRVDEQGKNLLGLGQVYMHEANVRLAIGFFSQAEELFNQMGIGTEAQVAGNLKREAQKKISG